jgi:hypothetical protein
MPFERWFVTTSAWLRLLLLLASLSLLFQLVPSLWWLTLQAIDVRNWPWPIGFAANALAILVLAGVRFGTDLYGEWLERKELGAITQAHEKRHQQLKAEREMLARMKKE